ncbi:alpha/beta hydrolase [Tenacibaculum sp. MEBiC06402]
MKQSISYYLTLGIIKLKGIKKSFSNDPVDYKTIRKEDVYQPKGSFFKKYTTKLFKVLESLVTQIEYKSGDSKKLLIFVHGGAFISGPSKHHWDTVKTLAKNTDFTIWLCNYPKAPEFKIRQISNNIDAIYNRALKNYKAENIILIGDSVGGTLVTALTQRLIAKTKELPKKLILVSPVMDASMSNTDIPIIENVDPMLSMKGILSAKKMCAGEVSLEDNMISPIYGSFKNFPETILFISENDIMYPDQLLAINKLKNENILHQVIIGKNMPHIWPFLPVMKEAKIALNQIINELNS